MVSTTGRKKTNQKKKSLTSLDPSWRTTGLDNMITSLAMYVVQTVANIIPSRSVGGGAGLANTLATKAI